MESRSNPGPLKVCAFGPVVIKRFLTHTDRADVLGRYRILRASSRQPQTSDVRTEERAAVIEKPPCSTPTMGLRGRRALPPAVLRPAPDFSAQESHKPAGAGPEARQRDGAPLP